MIKRSSDYEDFPLILSLPNLKKKPNYNNKSRMSVVHPAFSKNLLQDSSMAIILYDYYFYLLQKEYFLLNIYRKPTIKFYYVGGL